MTSMESNGAIVQQSALDAVKFGLRITPAGFRDKKPKKTGWTTGQWTTDPDEVCKWWPIGEDQNIFGVMGNGLITIDVDRDDICGFDGNENLRELENQYGELPETSSFTTGRGGYQLLYRVDREIRGFSNPDLHIDVRGDGSGAILPGSVHPNGKEYIWENSPDDIPIAQANETVYKIIDAIRPKSNDRQAFELPKEMPTGSRNQNIFDFGCSLQAKGLSDDVIASAMEGINQSRGNPPLKTDELQRTIQSVLSYPKGHSKDFDDIRAGTPLWTPRKIDPSDPIPLQPEIMEGYLRQQGVALISGPSKAAKTYLSIHLGICAALGDPWLGVSIKQCRVLNLDFEVDPGETDHRLLSVMESMQLTSDQIESVRNNLDIMNFRGQVVSITQLLRLLLDNVQAGQYDLIIIDPIYKIMEGDENSAEHVRKLTNALDAIANSLKVSVIYTGHHSKGAKGEVKAMDRISGSGVFARHADLIIDLIELDRSDEYPNDYYPPDIPAFRFDITARSFKKPASFDTYFLFPRHRVDTTGLLTECEPITPAKAGGTKRGRQMRRERLEKLSQVEAEALSRLESTSSIKSVELASELGLDPKTIVSYVNESKYLRIVQIGRANYIEKLDRKK